MRKINEREEDEVIRKEERHAKEMQVTVIYTILLNTSLLSRNLKLFKEPPF
jgi:hypothetical protein